MGRRGWFGHCIDVYRLYWGFVPAPRLRFGVGIRVRVGAQVMVI